MRSRSSRGATMGGVHMFPPTVFTFSPGVVYVYRQLVTSAAVTMDRLHLLSLYHTAVYRYIFMLTSPPTPTMSAMLPRSRGIGIDDEGGGPSPETGDRVRCQAFDHGGGVGAEGAAAQAGGANVARSKPGFGAYQETSTYSRIVQGIILYAKEMPVSFYVDSRVKCIFHVCGHTQIVACVRGCATLYVCLETCFPVRASPLRCWNSDMA